MINNFTQIQSTRMPTHFMTYIGATDADSSLKRLLPEAKLTERKLQAMIVYLGLDIDLESATPEDLKRYIGSYLHAIYPPNVASTTTEVTSTVTWLQYISNREATPEEGFDFLYRFGRDGAHSLLVRCNILNRTDISLAFSRSYPLEITIRYLFDSSVIPVPQVILALPSLKESTLTLKGWDSRVDWFRSGSQLNQKKIDAANLYFSKQKVWFQPFFKLDDVKDFFYGFTSDSDKELVFRKIRANYLNKKSREESNAKQCNFSLRKHSERMIDEVARSNGVTRSMALDAILHSGNKKELQELFEKGIKNLPVPMKKFNDGLPKFSFNIGPSSSAMVYQVNPTPTSGTPLPASDSFAPHPQQGVGWLR